MMQRCEFSSFKGHRRCTTCELSNFLDFIDSDPSLTPIPRHVMRVVDNLLPPRPRLEDFGTELLAVVGWQQSLANRWHVPDPRPEQASLARHVKLRNRYQP